MRSEYIYDPSWGENFIPEEARLVNGIHPDICRRFGVPLSGVVREINHLIKTHRVDAIVGHNARSFDLPFLLHHIEGLSTDHWDELKVTPLIDTMTDVEYPKRCKSKALTYLCADHGFLNANAHSALSDVQATLKLAEHYDLKAALERGKIPSALYKAQTKHPKLDDGYSKDKAKACGFSWQNLEGREFPLSWVKRIRENELEATIAELGFGVVKIG